MEHSKYVEIKPPRRGAVWALTVDSTARPYDLTQLDIGGEKLGGGKANQKIEVAIWMQAETNDVYFHFAPASANDLDHAAAQAAGAAAAAPANTHGAVLKAGNVPQRFVITRGLDVFLIVKTATTGGILRVWAASQSF